MTRAVRALVGASLVMLVAAGVMPVATAAVGVRTISSAGPLNSIILGDELSCQIDHVDTSTYEFYPPRVAPGDCGTFAFVDGVLFSPDLADHGRTATAGLGVTTPHTPVSQSEVTGAGSGDSPFAVTTTVTAGPLQIVQVDSYVPGAEFYRTGIEVTNTGARAESVILYRALDCYLDGSDRGLGFVDQVVRAPGCRGPTDAGSSGIVQLVPITGGHRYYEDSFSDVWARIGSHRAFRDTCECTLEKDNGIGVSWTFDLRPGAVTERSLVTTFSHEGRRAVAFDASADDRDVAPGSATGYTISAANPNLETVTVSSITGTLPDGFTYVPGSTSGATTADPTVSERTLTWTGDFSLSSTAETGALAPVLHFGVTASSEDGIYFNEVTGAAGSFPVAPSGPTARIHVGVGKSVV